MILAQIVNVPPVPKLMDYPASLGIACGVVFTAILLVIVKHFDASGGTLTISIMVTLAFIGVVIFCLLFTVPSDEATSAVIGGLTAAFGAVMAYWLGRNKS